MTPQRVTLSRIIAVNWYGYRQFIDVRGLTLITGANGSGKSALLDLIQFVLLGEQTSRFNKAAAGAGSGRTLRGYALCDTNTVGRDGQERYLRTSGVTLAALEFSWPPAEGEEEPRRETWGARIEYDSPTSKARTVWFMVPRRIEEPDFLAAGDPSGGLTFLPEDEFRVRWRRDFQGEIWDRQTTYLDEMALRVHLAFDRPQMNKTLPSAMAFQPVENFERFIREYLLEPALPDVKAVRASVDAHRRAQERLGKMNDQRERLAKISAHHAACETARREAGLWLHLRDALAHEEAGETLRVREEKRAKLRAEHESNSQQRAEAIAERDALRVQLDEVMREVFKDDSSSRLDELRQKHETATVEVRRLRGLKQQALDFLHGRQQGWKQWLRIGASLGVPEPEEASNHLTRLNGADTSAALDASVRLARTADELLQHGQEQVRSVEESLHAQERRERQIQEDLKNYQEGRTAASPLLDALRARGQRAVALGRVVEVTRDGEKWWPLLETLLIDDRQAILPEDFPAAWETAQQVPGAAEPLIHPDEVRSLRPAVVRGSLRGFIETAHPAASAWLDVRLGNIMPVKRTPEMDAHERALSADGWLKDPPRRVHLTAQKELTLGENGLRRMRAEREAELADVQTSLTELRRAREDWKHWMQRGAKEWCLNDPAVPEGVYEIRRLHEEEREAEGLAETIGLLATPEREAAVRRMNQLRGEERGASERAVRLEERLRIADQQDRELSEGIAAAAENEKSLAISRQESRVRIPGVSDPEILQRVQAARQQPGTWRQRTEQAAELARQRTNEAEAAAQRRDNERRSLIAPEAHPELADVFDLSDPSNDRYDFRLRELEDQELPRFQSEAEKARRDWEERLQHQVLDVLRDKLAEADRTKRELNQAMNHEIGGWRYQLSSTADRSHTAIWTLVEKGLPSGENLELFNAAAREEVDRAKAELMAAIEAADQPGENRHQKTLDYRYYHRWDIKAQPAGRGEGSAISLNRSAKKQSGGENQAPFFVAMLAAFRRVYDTGHKQPPSNLGLVVMDEAFSKLSGDRIDDCLALAKNFGLQLLMAFPEDRLPTMAGHADTIVQCRVDRAYDEKSGTVTGIENWVVRVDRERLREVLA